MNVPLTFKDIEQLIINGVEENISLDYKAADALQNTEGRKKEIAKDVSAMANAAGGIIIYGVKEFDADDKKHLPEKITPINRTKFSKEQLEQIINSNISPKIDGIKIHAIPLSKPDEVVYIVEIPQSNTAHQNTKDQRYYRRYNFLAEPMLDYEIRDIMNRLKYPLIEIGFEIQKHTYEDKSNTMFQQYNIPQKKCFKTDITLKIFPVNSGSIYAKYINYYIHLPKDIADTEESSHLKKIGTHVIEFYGENTYRDVVDYVSNPIGLGYPKYGPSRFDPVLPGLKGRSEKLKLIQNPVLDEREITWTVYADNATQKTGSIKLNQIPIIEINEEIGNE